MSAPASPNPSAQPPDPATVLSESTVTEASVPLLLEPMDPQITSIQPGGGVVMQMELAWGKLRRSYLKLFRKGYVRRMEQLRRGNENRAPHDVLDPRDLKFYQNQGGWYWAPEDDPFRSRDRIPFARWGLAELQVFSLCTFGPAALLAWLNLTQSWSTGLIAGVWVAVAALIIIGILIVWFFRDPGRLIPVDAGLVVAPADGKVVAIDEIEHDEFIGGPAIQIGIFLSIFNVHINRAPVPSRVIGLRYRKGKFLNALRPESARENEQLAIRLQETSAPFRRMIVRQITGAIARRIVCWLKPGDVLSKGERVGMIKLGSRTELVLPREPGMQIAIQIGDKVQAGSTVFVVYPTANATGE